MKTQNKETGSWYDINSNMIYVLKNMKIDKKSTSNLKNKK